MTYPADHPVVAVRLSRAGEHYELELCRADGTSTLIDGATVSGGLRHPGDVLVHLLAHGVAMADAENYVEQLEPGFDARAALTTRSETDMAAWRAADYLRREERKAEFRRTRGH